jgi:hypothetical protein
MTFSLLILIYLKNIEIAEQFRYSRGIIPLFRGVSRRDSVFLSLGNLLNKLKVIFITLTLPLPSKGEV